MNGLKPVHRSSGRVVDANSDDLNLRQHFAQPVQEL